MTQSSKIAAAALTALVLAATGFTAIPSHGSARVVDAGGAGIAAERIASAFALAPAVATDASIQIATRIARKGDLGARPACFGGTWPDVAPGCLTLADGSAAPAIRSVTVGVQSGESTTMLIRVPAPQVASR